MSLEELEENLRLTIADSSLTLNTAFMGDVDLGKFINTMPGQSLTLSEVDLYYLENERITLNGVLAEDWLIKGVTTSNLKNIRFEVLFEKPEESDSITSRTSINYAEFTIDSCTLGMHGEVSSNGVIQLNIKEYDESPNLGLSTIFNSLSNSSSGHFLGGIDIFDLLPISDLIIQFGFEANVSTSISFRSDLVGDFSFIDDIGFVNQPQVHINMNHQVVDQERIETSYYLKISGALTIDSVYQVEIFPVTNRIWKLQLVNEDNSSLPTLERMSGWIGGDNLKNIVNDGMLAIGFRSISVHGICLSFDFESKRLVNLSLGCRFQIGRMVLEANMSLPNFQLSARLDPSSKLNFKNLIDDYFYYSDNFPEIIISDLIVNAQPDTRFYSIYGRLEESWSFSIFGDQNLLLENLEFTLNWINGSVNGSIGGSLGIFEINFILQAFQDQPNSGWQFVCKSEPHQNLSILDLASGIKEKFGLENDNYPDALAGIVFTDLELSFNTRTRDFKFQLATKLDVGGKSLEATIVVELQYSDQNYHRKYHGTIHVGDLQFDLILNQSGVNRTLLATYDNASGKEENIDDLVALITDNDTLVNTASGIIFQLKDALLVRDNNGTDTKMLLGLDVNGSLDLSSLPLIGSKLPSGANLRVAMQPVIASADFETSRLERIRPIVPGNGFKLPSEINGGLGVNFQLFIGEEPIELFLDNILSEEDQKTTITQPEASSVTSTSLETTVLPSTTDDIKWFSIQKNVGPVHFSRIGVQFHEGKFYFLLDVSITAVNLTISLDGLYVSSALNPLQPQFGLHGLGINYQKDQVEVGGAFLRNTISQNGNTYDTYDGAAVIRTENFSLSALGAYSYYQGHPSLFVYAFSDTIVGGPSFFFVTGLAAGFGYNRRLVLPSVRDVPRFPLVAEARAGNSDSANSLTAEVVKLHHYIPPATGESFLVVGVRFTSFKIIDSFALLSANLSDEFELNVVGLSTMIIPVGKGVHDGPLAVVQMALRAVYNPARGYLKVRSSLTRSSYVLSRDCHLTGDFAFFSWFSGGQDRGARAGDFVLTMGGYHPHFRRPAHYPSIRPLAFNWKVNSHTTVKGRLYFALTPSMAMAGGNLEATWKSGSIKAWFEVGADFLISWKPYFYEASAHVRVGVSYTYHFFGTHHISTHVGADLTMWGPEFSGRAHVHLWIVSFTIHFGAHASREPKALDWEAFSSGFLPEREKWLNVSVTQGLVREIRPESDATDALSVYVVNPRKVVLETHAAIPITESTFEVVPEPDESEMEEDKDSIDPSAEVQTTDYQDVPIGSMKITDSIISTHKIKISKDGQMDEVTKDFTITPVKKSVPAALWGKVFKQDRHHINQNALIDDACVGFKIEGAAPCPSQDSMDVSNYDLLNEIEYFQNKNFRISTPDGEELEGTWLQSAANQWHVRDTLEGVTSDRNEFLKEIGFEKNYYPNTSLLDELIITTSN